MELSYLNKVHLRNTLYGSTFEFASPYAYFDVKCEVLGSANLVQLCLSDRKLRIRENVGF